jgi:hypothetical protein
MFERLRQAGKRGQIKDSTGANSSAPNYWTKVEPHRPAPASQNNQTAKFAANNPTPPETPNVPTNRDSSASTASCSTQTHPSTPPKSTQQPATQTNAPTVPHA